MTKKNYTDSELFLCECGSAEHQIIFQTYDFSEGMTPETLTEWPVEERQAFSITIFLNQYRGFFKRLWVAIKYLFGYKCRYGDFDTIMLGTEDAERMVKSLQGYLNLVKRWEK